MRLASFYNAAHAGFSPGEMIEFHGISLEIPQVHSPSSNFRKIDPATSQNGRAAWIKLVTCLERTESMLRHRVNS